MSKFFKALEQAEQERALREQAERREGDATGVGSKGPATGREEPPCAGSPTRAPFAPRAMERPVPEESRGPEPRPTPGAAGGTPDGVEQHLVSLLAPTACEAEQYRTLRHMVERRHKDADLTVVAVSSAAQGDGKTTTAINLAGALAQAPEARVLVVDADLRSPSVTEHVGLGPSGEPGLVDAVLDPGLPLQGVVRLCPPFNLAVLPAGRTPAAPYEVLKSPRLGELLAEARRHYDYVVLDTPPLVPFPDCRLIGKWVDGLLVVVAAHKTPRKLLEEGLRVVDPAKILGLVFNKDDRPVSGYYYRPAQPPNGNWMGRLSRAVKKVGARCRLPHWAGRRG